MTLRFLALWCGVLIASSLIGCATLPEKTVTPRTTEARQRLYDLPAWKLEGRIAAKTGSEGWNANLFWEHDGGQERLRIFGPFSQGAVSIIVQNDLVYVNEGNGITSFSRDPDAYLKNRLGFTIPLQSLRFWVLGLPAPGIDYQAEGGSSGGLKGFQQQGWVMAYESFDAVGDLLLPRKMSIRGHEVVLKLIADDWVIKK